MSAGAIPMLVRRALKTLLQGPRYQAALDAAAVEAGFGAAMQPLATVRTTESSVLPTLPAIEMDTQRQTRRTDSDAIMRNVDVMLFVVHSGSDEERLQEELEVYVDAIERLFDPDQQTQGMLMPLVANGPIEVVDADFSPTLPGERESEPYVKAAAVRLRVLTITS